MVHIEPQHPQRIVLSAARSGLHARHGPDRHRRPRFLLGGETPGEVGRQLSLRRGSALRPDAGRYRIEKEIIADPHRDAVLQRIFFSPTYGILNDYLRYALLAPHLANCGWGNSAWIGEYKGIPMLFAQRENCALALASSAPRLKRSVGFVGCSDDWQDVRRSKTITAEYARPENGNVALIGEVEMKACAGSSVLALGFGQNPAEAGHRAIESARWLRTEPCSLRAWLANAAEIAPLPGRQSRPLVQSLPREYGSAACPRIGAAPRCIDRQSVRAVRIYQRRRGPRWIASRLVARSRGIGGHTARRMSSCRNASCSTLFAGNAGSRRPLGTEPVARRRAALERHTDGRDRVSNSARRSRPPRSRGARGRTEQSVGDGAVRGQLPRAQWPGHPTGPLRGGRGLFAFHACSRNSRVSSCAELADIMNEAGVAVFLRETADIYNDSIER